MLGLGLGTRFPRAMARLALVWGGKTMTETGKELCTGSGVNSWDMVGMRTKRGFVGHLGWFSGPVAKCGVAGHWQLARPCSSCLLSLSTSPLADCPCQARSTLSLSFQPVSLPSVFTFSFLVFLQSPAYWQFLNPVYPAFLTKVVAHSLDQPWNLPLGQVRPVLHLLSPASLP